jgi:hypothetical protein
VFASQFVRTTSSYASWVPAIISFATWAKWTQLATITTTQSIFTTVVTKLELDMRSKGIRVQVQVRFQKGAFDVRELGRVAAARMRVLVVLAYSPDVVTVALAAKEQGMLKPGWAWLGLDTVAGAETFAADGPKSASAALHGWMYFEPSTTAPTAFFDRVRETTRARFPQPPRSDEVPESLSTPFAANMYDAVMLYAVAAASNSSRLANGVPSLKAMTSVSFDGMTGRVELDENGDMKESIRALNYVLDTDEAMHGRLIGVIDGPSGRYLPLQNGTVSWPGDLHSTPADFAEELHEEFNTAWLLVGASVSALVVVIGVVVVVWRNRKRLQAIILMLLTEVSQLVLSGCMSLASLVTDGIVFDTLLHGGHKISTEIYTAAFATVLCFGTITTALSFGYRIHNARGIQAQLHRLDPRAQGVAAKVAHRQAKQHQWELLQTDRTKVTLSLSLMTLMAQGVLAPNLAYSDGRVRFRDALADLPMSLLNGCLIFFEDIVDKKVRASCIR